MTGRAARTPPGLTLRQLLDHTSGLPNYFTEPAILDAVRDGGGRRRFTPLDLINLAAAAPPPSSPPGTARSYTDTGFVLAGLIIESLTGGPLDAGYRDLVLDPAGMTDTWLESSDETPRRDAISPHEFEGLDLSGMDPTVDWAGGGLVSTAADLAALLRGLVQGESGERRGMDGDDPLAGRADRLLRRVRAGPRPLPVPDRDLRWPPRGLGCLRVLVTRTRRHRDRHGQHGTGRPTPAPRRDHPGASSPRGVAVASLGYDAVVVTPRGTRFGNELSIELPLRGPADPSPR